MIQLFVGLGNPGAEYAETRHNAGFWWLDALARQWGLSWQAERGFHGLVAKGSVRGHTVWLLQPQTYMNRSGLAVAALARFYKIPPQHLLVAHDELDLPPGEAKLKRGGGHAGHNGLRDIHAQLGSADYWRLRIGIGHPGHKAEVVNWVLKKPSPADRTAIDEALQRSLAAADTLLSGQMERATAAIHTRTPPRPKPPRPAAVAPNAGHDDPTPGPR